MKAYAVAHLRDVDFNEQAILRLRTDNSNGVAFLVEGVPPDYRGADKLAQRH